jgi:hypothetical protein
MEYVPIRKQNMSLSRTVKSKGRQSSQPGKKGDSGSFGPDGRMVKFVMNPKSSVVRRKFLATFVIASGAGGDVPIASIGVAGMVNSFLGTEFTNYAQEYQQYRVKSIKIHSLPRTTSATSTTGPYQTAFIIAPYLQFPLTTLNSLQQAEQKEVWSTLQETKVFVASPLNANLWNEFNVTYPADRDFGFSYGLSVASTFAASSSVALFSTEIDVEFRRAQ